jgi:hypothetical protein
MRNCTRTRFAPLFESELHLLKNPICEQCDAQIRHPLLPWLVGERFSASVERVVFVGKPHRGVPGTLLPSGIIDPSKYPPAKPGALVCEPLKAALRGR